MSSFALADPAFVNAVVRFLLENFETYTAHPIEFCLNDTWESQVPECWRQALPVSSFEELRRIPLGFFKEEWPESLKHFVSTAFLLRLPRVPADLSALYSRATVANSIPAVLTRCMNVKKRHEVQRLSELVHRLSRETSCSAVVDLGAGQGFISQVLAFHSGLHSLCIESSPSRTESNRDRVSTLSSLKSSDRPASLRAITLSVDSGPDSDPAALFARLLPDLRQLVAAPNHPPSPSVIDFCWSTELDDRPTAAPPAPAPHDREVMPGCALRLPEASGASSGASGEASGARGEVSGASGEASGARGEVSGASGEASGARGEVSGASGEASGARGEVSGASGEASGARGEVSGASGEASPGSGEASGARGEVSGASGEASAGSGEASSVSRPIGISSSDLSRRIGVCPSHPELLPLDASGDGAAESDVLAHLAQLALSSSPPARGRALPHPSDEPPDDEALVGQPMRSASPPSSESDGRSPRVASVVSSRADAARSGDPGPDRPPPAVPFLLLGLHSCGDLGPFMLRLFVESSAEALVLVSCCYNLMSQAAPGRDCHEVKTFPMSSVMRASGLRLGWRARSLAAASPERWAESGLSPTQIRTDCHRAALEVILRRHYPSFVPEERWLRKLPHDSLSTFSAYAHAALGRFGLTVPHEFQDDDGSALQSFYDSVMPNPTSFACFDALRTALGPSIETSLLLDRALYLKINQRVPHVALVPLFDPCVSPRSVALVACKQPLEQSMYCL